MSGRYLVKREWGDIHGCSLPKVARQFLPTVDGPNSRAVTGISRGSVWLCGCGQHWAVLATEEWSRVSARRARRLARKAGA